MTKNTSEYCWEKYGDLMEKTIEWFRTKGSRYRAKPWKQLFIEKYSHGTVLDLGGGIASTSRYYLDKKIIEKLVIVDLAEKPLLSIKNTNIFTIKICGDILEYIFLENYFDTIYLLAVLHHIPGKECRIELLKNIKQMLRRNGYLIITVWNPDIDALKKKYMIKTLESEKDILICDSVGCRYYHLYSVEELCNEIRFIEMEIVEKGYFYQNIKQKNLTCNIYVVAKKK
ncbi:class I SAM-dependent methyltransferase [Staphylothermus hellenicus]|uniref:Methyltransferase type 12 n=1 Tax=Staphylothermus hellenicus (strain DSM 12710 / JCM 10830 / BK20S6-10-b1 / P8) TaxID=591019 RepID=D7D8D6_STAHD|nr:class I SAM-dependent methyltransferase [Staphylothermus hellenicus]ADI32032.1 Methyltransferase type 12 [Staphylothermus hellenicus DSM 12710]